MYRRLTIPIRAALLVTALVTSAEAQTAPAAAPAAAPLTVEQAVREAMDRNLGLLAERFNIDVARAAVVTAGLRPNPVVFYTAVRPDQTLWDSSISPNEHVFRTDVPLEGGGKRARRLDQASLAVTSTEQQFANTMRALVLDVQSAFTAVQLAGLNLALAQENLRTFGDVVQVNTERVRAGDLSVLELSRTRLAAVQFQTDVRQRETALQTAWIRLRTILGRGAQDDRSDVAGDLRHDAAPSDYDALVRAALDRRPDLKASRTEQARSVADTRLQIANGKIDYTVSGEYHRQTAPGTSGNAFAVALSVPLPIFARNQGEITRATLQQQQLRLRTEALAHDIAGELAIAWAEYTAARDIVETIERQMLQQARDVRATTEYAYRRGEASFVEFLDAVRAFNETMQGYNGARAEYARTLYALDSISGQVTP